MKAKDIKVGKQYALREGKYGNPMRCIVLDPEAAWFNGGNRWLSLTGRDYRLTRRRSYGETQPRYAVAVELPNGKWTGAMNQPIDQREWIALPPVWVPYAALSRSIVRPWAEQEELNEAARRQQEAARKLYEEREAIRCREAEVRAAENARIAAEQKRQQALRDELFESRIEGPLVEAIGTEGWRRWQGDRTVAIELETLARLLEMLPGSG